MPREFTIKHSGITKIKIKLLMGEENGVE